jgi:hypothetical protein
MRYLIGLRARLAALSLILLATAFSVAGQDQAPPQGDLPTYDISKLTEQPESSATASAPIENAAATPSSPIDTQIHPSGRAIPWLGTSSRFRWGHFSVADFTYNYVRDSFRPDGGLPANILDLSVFRMTLAWDQYFGKQHLVLQYDPQLAILNGRTRGNGGLNNSFALGTTFTISPRLTVTFKNGFAQVQSRQLFPVDVLAVDQQAGGVVQNQFLQNDGSYIEDAATLTFAYRISPRTLLTVSPGYRYAQTTNSQISYIANGHTIEQSTALTYALTARQTIGVIYTTELLRAANVPNAANTYFSLAALYYGNQLSKTWRIEGRFGDDLAFYPGGLPTVHAMAGGFTLVKALPKSTFAIAYDRGRTEMDFITARFGERADVVYEFHPFLRLAWYNGAGFYSDLGLDPRTRGTYAASRLEFALSKNLVVFADYLNGIQHSTTPQLLSGIRNTSFGGIRWTPPPLGAH